MIISITQGPDRGKYAVMIERRRRTYRVLIHDPDARRAGYRPAPVEIPKSWARFCAGDEARELAEFFLEHRGVVK